jgi:hypothetical protein
MSEKIYQDQENIRQANRKITRLRMCYQNTGFLNFSKNNYFFRRKCSPTFKPTNTRFTHQWQGRDSPGPIYPVYSEIDLLLNKKRKIGEKKGSTTFGCGERIPGIPSWRVM